MLGATYRGSEWLGVAADFSGGYGSENFPGGTLHARQHNFLFGPRVYIPLADNPKWKPFGELLLGAARATVRTQPTVGTATSVSDTSFAWTLGGGVDYQLNENFRLRAFQLGILHTSFSGGSETHAKLGVGLVYEFGVVR